MKNRFNEDDVIRFIYDDMEPAEKVAFSAALAEDDALRASYDSFADIHQQLATISFEPSDASIEKVMDFARHLPPVEADLPDASPGIIPITPALRGRLRILRMSNTAMAAAIVLLLVFGISLALINQSTKITTGGSATGGGAISISQQQEEKRLQWEDSAVQKDIDTLRKQLDRVKQHQDGF